MQKYLLAVFKIFDLRLCKFPEGSFFKSAEPYLSDGHSLEFLDGIANGLAHLSHLAVLSFGDGYLKNGGVLVFADDGYPGGFGHIASDIYAIPELQSFSLDITPLTRA